MPLTTLEDYVKREIFKTDKELFDFCPACDETGNTFEALMKGLFNEAKKILADAKITTDNFFDNVIVNDENLDIKKNRLESVSYTHLTLPTKA